MYTEQPRKVIDWNDLLKKGIMVLIIIAIVLLIVWLFTRNSNQLENNINVKQDDNTKTNEVKKLDKNIYSNEFISGYTYFHDTAKDYFLVKDLPENGMTLKFTLQEMINKELILPFTYKNNRSCDTEASYVTVKNENGKYTLTTTLVCGNEVATTKEILGCNKLCNNGNCNNDDSIVEYQFKKKVNGTSTVYNCPAGYTKSGSGANTKCYKTNKTTIKATKDVSYTCPKGYKKVGAGETSTCVKNDTKTINATKKTTYSCPSGYTLDGKKCYKTTSSKDAIDANENITYSCPSDYILDGDKCYKTSTSTSTIPATEHTTYSCPSSDYKLSGSTCTKTTTTNATAKTSYSCSSGTLVNTKYCRIYSTSNYYNTYKTYKGVTYNGCSYSGSYTESCSTYKGCTISYYKYYCSKTTYKDVAAKGTTSYSCPSSDYKLSGSTCTKTTTTNATAKTSYSCSSGTLSGSKCIKTSTTSASSNTSYSCPSGYTLNGSTCYKTSTSKETIDANKKTTYTCPKGYKKDGSKCTTSAYKNETIKATKNITYKCSKGTKTKSNTCVITNYSYINPTTSTQNGTSYDYKWSTETSIEGWERTGQTRNKTVSSK